MQELVQALPVFSGLIEKGGVIGVLLVVVGFLIWDRVRLVKRVERTFAERDMSRMIEVRYKSFLDQNKIVVDISDIVRMFNHNQQGGS